MTTWIPVTLAAFTLLVVKSGLKVVPELGVAHDEHAADPSYAFSLSRITQGTHGKVPLGVFRDVERDSYDELLQAQLDNAKGEGDLQALLGSGDTWSIT